MEKGKLLNSLGQLPQDQVEFVFENNKFIAYLYEPVQELILVSGGKIFWHKDSQQPIELVSEYEDSLFDAFTTLYLELRKALNGQLEISPKLAGKNMGYMWNLICAQDPDAEVEYRPLVGKHNLWWSGAGYITWLYTHNGQTILEITPFYAWTAETMSAEEDDTLEAFRERMKQYKPLAKFILPPEVVQQWFEQVKELVAIIYKNYERDGGAYVNIETDL